MVLNLQVHLPLAFFVLRFSVALPTCVNAAPITCPGSRPARATSPASSAVKMPYQDFRCLRQACRDLLRSPRHPRVGMTNLNKDHFSIALTLCVVEHSMSTPFSALKRGSGILKMHLSGTRLLHMVNRGMGIAFDLF